MQRLRQVRRAVINHIFSYFILIISCKSRVYDGKDERNGIIKEENMFRFLWLDKELDNRW